MEMNHVLVVEDDKEIREGVEIYLKSQGYEVFQAADGIEGLEVIEKEDKVSSPPRTGQNGSRLPRSAVRCTRTVQKPKSRTAAITLPLCGISVFDQNQTLFFASL